MSFAETAQLVARLSLKDDFSRPLGKVSGSLNTFKSNLGKVGKAAVVGVGAAVGVGIAVIGRSVKSGLDSLAELESATTSVDGAIKQMGLTGQVTSQQIAGWANDIEHDIEAAFDDKEITQAATTLIRFGKVTTSNLKPALTVIADLATKTGSVDSAAKLLARALADPTKAAGKLAKSGVILTKAQENQIKAMVEAGDVAGAQAVLLDAVAVATEGAAKAANGPFVDSQNVLRDVVEDAQRALATGFLPVLMEVRDILSTELAKKDTLDNIKKFGEGLAGGLKGLIQTARGLPWDLIGDSLSTAAAGGKALLDAFLGLPPWIQGAVASGWGLNKLTGGAVLKIGVELVEDSVKGLVTKLTTGSFFGRGATPANPMFVKEIAPGVGGKGGVPLPAAGGAAAGGVGALGLTLGTLLPVVTAAVTAWASEEFNKNPEKQRLGIEGNLQATTGLDLAAFQNLVVFAEAIPKFIDELNNPTKDTTRASEPITPADLREANRIAQVSNGETRADVQGVRDSVEAGRNAAKVSADAQIAALNATRDKVEAGRIATVSAVDNVRDKVETGRIATVSAVDTTRASIEAGRIATVSALDTSKAAIVTAVGLPRPMSPDERTEFAALKAKNDAVRDKIEASRIATTTALGDLRTATTTGATNTQTAINSARDKIEASRIAQVSATSTAASTIANRAATDADRIVTAIRNKDFSVKVTVNSSGSPDDRDKPKVTVQTGGNVNRATANQSGGPDDRG